LASSPSCLSACSAVDAVTVTTRRLNLSPFHSSSSLLWDIRSPGHTSSRQCCPKATARNRNTTRTIRPHLQSIHACRACTTPIHTPANISAWAQPTRKAQPRPRTKTSPRALCTRCPATILTTGSAAGKSWIDNETNEIGRIIPNFCHRCRCSSTPGYLNSTIHMPEKQRGAHSLSFYTYLHFVCLADVSILKKMSIRHQHLFHITTSVCLSRPTRRSLCAPTQGIDV